MESSKTLKKIRKIDLLIIASAALTLLAIMVFHLLDIDVEIQNHLFDFENKTWLVDRNEPVKRLLIYKLPKVLFGLVMIASLVLAILGFKKKSSFLFHNRHKFFLLFFGLAFISLIAGNIKKFTNIYCPCQLEIYDGTKPYIKILENYPQEFRSEKRGVCFPAGHAVTGFALFILFFIFETKSRKIISLFGALIFGWILGFYQMAKGVHFFSDTFISMLLCFLLAAIIARLYELRLAKRSN